MNRRSYLCFYVYDNSKEFKIGIAGFSIYGTKSEKLKLYIGSSSRNFFSPLKMPLRALLTIIINLVIIRELLTELTTRLNELTEDHQRKSQALSLDNKCMGVREKLPSHDCQVKNQCDRNMKLTGTLRNSSRFLENSTVVK